MRDRLTMFGGLFALLIATVGAGCATGNSARSAADAAAVGSGQASTKAKAAFGVRKPKHVGVALMTAHDMLHEETSQPAEAVAIVACGPAIRALSVDSKLADRVRQGLEEDVQIKACGVTVERMGFDASRFIDGVEVVPNGFTELIRLQKQGYQSVEL